MLIPMVVMVLCSDEKKTPGKPVKLTALQFMPMAHDQVQNKYNLV